MWSAIRRIGRRQLADDRRTMALFLLIATSFGVFFTFMTPLLWGADETTHVGRVYQIAHGHVRSYEQTEPDGAYGFGGAVPETLRKLIYYVNTDFNANGPQPIFGIRWVDVPADYVYYAHQSMQTRLVPYNFSNTAIYSPLSYIPSVIGFVLADWFKLSLGPTIYLGRLCTLALYILLVAMALHVLRRHRIKWVVFAVALLPSTLYQGSFINADAVTNGLAFLLIAIVLHALLSDVRLRRLAFGLLLGCIVLLPITKPTYAFLSLLPLIIPLKRLPHITRVRLILLAAIIIGFGLYGVWQVETRYLSNASKWILAGVSPWWAQIDSAAQLHYVLQHPFSFVAACARTALAFDNLIFTSLFGRLGFSYMPTPGLAQLLSVVSLAIAVLYSETFRLRWRQLLTVIAICFTCIAAIFGTFYLTITAVGAATVEGVQGRYFLPLLPLVLAAVAMSTDIRLALTRPSRFRIEAGLVAIVLISLLLSALKYRYVIWG